MSHIQLCDDRVLIRRIEEPSSLLLTDAPKGIKGIVIATGPGKWIAGGWYKRGEWFKWREKGPWLKAGEWEYEEGYRQPMEIKAGMSVLFNSKWNDFTASENIGTGSDFSGPLERPLPLDADRNLHLIREADIFCIIPDLKIQASVNYKPVSENIEIIGPWNGGDPNQGIKTIHHG